MNFQTNSKLPYKFELLDFYLQNSDITDSDFSQVRLYSRMEGESKTIYCGVQNGQGKYCNFKE